MLPSDPDYKTPAPENVKDSPLLKKLLELNCDPYAEHSYNPAMIKTIEESLG